MTPGGLRHQLPRHSNPSENANEFFTLNERTTPPPKGRLFYLGEAKPRVSNPLPRKGAGTQTHKQEPRTKLVAGPFATLGSVPAEAAVHRGDTGTKAR